MKREYRIATFARCGVLTITEHPDRIELRLTFDRYGELGDEADILRQLRPLLAPFDSDPRPLAFDAPDLGQHAVIDFDAQGRPFAVVAEEPRQ
jgi:hypothetical protein